VESWAR